MATLPTVLDIPLKVEKTQQTPTPSLSTTAAKDDDLVRAVLKYHNEKGRNAILSVAKTIYHDFGQYNQSLSVALIQNDLDKLKEDSNVEWFEGDGKVIYCSIR
jgi:hypothetical protein